MTETTKAFDSLAVAGVYTGMVLEEGGGIHEVMDHLYPGIMTLGTAVMQPAWREPPRGRWRGSSSCPIRPR